MEPSIPPVCLAQLCLQLPAPSPFLSSILMWSTNLAALSTEQYHLCRNWILAVFFLNFSLKAPSGHFSAQYQSYMQLLGACLLIKKKKKNHKKTWNASEKMCSSVQEEHLSCYGSFMSYSYALIMLPNRTRVLQVTFWVLLKTYWSD